MQLEDVKESSPSSENEKSCFLRQTNQLNSVGNARTRPRKTGNLFRTVRNAMVATMPSSASNQGPFTSGTPKYSRRTQSNGSQVSFKPRLSSNRSNHEANCTCSKCYDGWMIESGEHNDATSITMDFGNGGICKITDSPHYLFTLAIQGNVKQMASLCNVNPERLFSLDRKGATILHHAAAANRVTVLELALSSPGGSELLSVLDDHGTSALHWAIVNDSSNSVEFLMKKGADPTVANNCGYPALHLAVQKNSLNSLRVLLQCNIDMNHKGVSGLTALHVASQADNAAAFELLLNAGAKPCTACSQGYRPLHTAAITGSRKVMKLLLEHGEKYGYTREQLLSYGDKEMSSPLHCAVTGGNICSIRVCLEYGARLDVRQADDSTPMHMVCGQGNLEVVKLMFETAPEQARATLFMFDKLDQTPLHKAAMYNHPNIIKYLVSKDADMEQMDSNHRTPLILAATRECWPSVRALVELGANWLVEDKDERNMMHIVVLKGANICYLTGFDEATKKDSEKLKTDDVQSLVSKPDAFGCTPLHYACQEGNLASLRCLMSLGVSARLKSWKNQSPLHFASMYGRFNACSRLLNSEQGPNILNEKDESGMTPLHFASMNGHIKVVQLLMNRGAMIHRNSCGESPLHVAAKNGYTKTIRILVEMHSRLTDLVEENGNTALHHAAAQGHVNAVQLLLDLNASFLRNNHGGTCFTEAIVNQNEEIAMCIVKHDRWEEAMRSFQKTDEGLKHPILLLIQYLPDVCVAVLNRCKEYSDADSRSPNYWIRYHFKYLQPPVNVRIELIKKVRESRRESVKSFLKNKKISPDEEHSDDPSLKSLALPALNTMVEFNRVQCLRHPVSVAYLKQKWQSYGKFVHGFNLIFFLLSLVPLTYLAANVNSKGHLESLDNATYVRNGTTFRYPAKQFTSFETAMMIQLTVINVLQMIKEVVQMFQQKVSYFFDPTNAIEWTLYICSVLYVMPFLNGYAIHWQFEVGAVAVFLAWFNLLVFLQKFDIAGIYVVMFMHILKTLLQVLLVFSFLIIAFALAFTVLMQNEADKAFSNPYLSIIRVLTMFLGEIDYVPKFLKPFVDDDPQTNHFGVPTFLLLLTFILMMPILLMNLLIGLAVGDIAEVQANAVLQRLAMQVQLHTSIESKLPAFFLQRVDKNHTTYYPNRCNSFFKQTWDQVFKYTGIQEDYGDSGESRSDPYMDYVQTELLKQKCRIKKMQTTLDKQHDLLRLIVQKMEIRSEADDRDEGSIDPPDSRVRKSASVLSSSARSKLMAVEAFRSKKI